MGLRPRPVSVAHSAGHTSRATRYSSGRTYGAPSASAAQKTDSLAVCAGHAGLSGALRTVALVPRWEVTAALPDTRCAPGSRESDGEIMDQAGRAGMPLRPLFCWRRGLDVLRGHQLVAISMAWPASEADANFSGIATGGKLSPRPTFHPVVMPGKQRPIPGTRPASLLALDDERDHGEISRSRRWLSRGR